MVEASNKTRLKLTYKDETFSHWLQVNNLRSRQILLVSGLLFPCEIQCSIMDHSKRKLRFKTFNIYTVGLVVLYGLFKVKFSPWDFHMLAIAVVYRL